MFHKPSMAGYPPDVKPALPMLCKMSRYRDGSVPFRPQAQGAAFSRQGLVQ